MKSCFLWESNNYICTENTCTEVSFFNKLARLQSATFCSKILRHRCFPVNFAKLLMVPFNKTPRAHTTHAKILTQATHAKILSTHLTHANHVTLTKHFMDPRTHGTHVNRESTLPTLLTLFSRLVPHKHVPKTSQQ